MPDRGKPKEGYQRKRQQEPSPLAEKERRKGEKKKRKKTRYKRNEKSCRREPKLKNKCIVALTHRKFVTFFVVVTSWALLGVFEKDLANVLTK
jgi:hypothetical protein